MSDVDRWGFPLKDLTRRRFQTALTILSLAICVSVTVFLILFGESLGVEVFSFVNGRLTIGFSAILYKFIVVVILLNSITGVIIAYFLISVTISEHMRDIGIMKAIGCINDVVFSYFSIELLVIVFVGCAIGTFSGIALNLAAIGLMNFMGFNISVKTFNPLLIILIFFAFAFAFYIFGTRQIVKVSKVEPARILSSLFVWKTEGQPTFRLSVLRKRNFVTKIALRDLGRRRSATIQSLACLSVVIASITLAVIGGIVANETTQKFVERAIGRDIVLIANVDIAWHYVNLLSEFRGENQTGMVSYLDEKYVIPNSIVSDLSLIDGIVKVDPRLVLETNVDENDLIIPDPKEPSSYIVIGDHRSAKALIVGVYSECLVNNWLIYGEILNESVQNAALVGDNLALVLFQRPLVQSFKMLGSEFKVVGVCLDPLNNGDVVYVPFNRLSQIVNHASHNLLLLQVEADPSIRSQILSEIENSISGKGLMMFDMNQVLDRHRAFLNYIWSLMLSLSLFTFVNAITSLIGYLILSISNQQRDLSIMRALGTKPKTVIQLILFETFLLVLGGGIIGLPIGTTIAFWFFIPDAVISKTATITIAALLSALMGVLCLSSLYPARKITKKLVTKAISQV